MLCRHFGLQACDGNSLGFVGADAFKFYFVACHALNMNVDETGLGGAWWRSSISRMDEFLEFQEVFAGRMRFWGVWIQGR